MAFQIPEFKKLTHPSSTKPSVLESHLVKVGGSLLCWLEAFIHYPTLEINVRCQSDNHQTGGSNFPSSNLWIFSWNLHSLVYFSQSSPDFPDNPTLQFLDQGFENPIVPGFPKHYPDFCYRAFPDTYLALEFLISTILDLNMPMSSVRSIFPIEKNYKCKIPKESYCGVKFLNYLQIGGLISVWTFFEMGC